MGSDGAGAGMGSVVPYLLEQFVVGDDAPSIIEKETQHLEFLRCKLHPYPGAQNLHTRKIDLNITKAVVFPAVGCILFQAPHRCAYSGQQLAWDERLGNIIVRS